MKTNLFPRLLIILIVAFFSTWIAVTKEPFKGIDLAGGTSLLYELDLDKVAATGNDTRMEIAQQVVNVLRDRVDPRGEKNISWRVMEQGKRIQIQMPYPPKATLEARDHEEAAFKELQATGWKESRLLPAIQKSGEERDAALEKFAPKGSEAYTALQELATAWDNLSIANSRRAAYVPGGPDTLEKLLNDRLMAQKAYDDKLAAALEKNVDPDAVKRLVLAADNIDNDKAREALPELEGKYPLQKEKIAAYVRAHKNLMAVNGSGVNDASELKRLVTRAGVLDFRIAVQPGTNEISSQQYQEATKSLMQKGPDQAVEAGTSKARWFAIAPNGAENLSGGGYVTVETPDGKYILCYDEHDRTITHSDPKRDTWSVKANSPYTDPSNGGLQMPFHLDPKGAGYMGEMTRTWKGHPMAILLDDRVMSAPTIQSQINESGVITFGKATAGHPMSEIVKEAQQLKQIMDAGSLSATLRPEPISEENISSDMGADNINAGIMSAEIAVIAVMGFMLLYYTITGAFADLALMLNLALVMATMWILQQRFTLPGIAGLVLTLGMAVDANVLINERIREELHRGASLWMAIKQGYDKVFWTIFDANLTTSLTSLVLIFVGSAEVKGFGVTLLIGLCIHMFTALFVTRTLMMAAVKWGIIKAIDDHSLAEYIKEICTFTWIRNGHWPFMRVITVTNIDWISKRYIFWGISGVITLAGLAAFIMRGEDKYDIEFRGGTQVTMQLKQPAAGEKSLSIDEVRKRVEELSSKPGLLELRGARVYTVGDLGLRRFQMQTTIANTPTTSIRNILLEPLAEAFKDVLEIKPKLTMKVGAIAPENIEKTDIKELKALGYLAPISSTKTNITLRDVFFNTPFTEMPPWDVTAFRGGAAILLEDVAPAVTAEKLQTRITSMRRSAEFSTNRPFAVLPVTVVDADGKFVPALENDTRPIRRAVLVTADEAFPYNVDSDKKLADWETKVATSEWKIINRTMSDEGLFEGVTTFDAVVASQAKLQALIAIVLSLLLIVVYVWVRFGGFKYGVGAILSLMHDAIVALAATVLSGVIVNNFFGGHPFLLMTDFKINLTMIAAYLTVIGYSVNDTIVIFDRVRELRGKSQLPLSKKLINDAINQCFGRTIWTTFTVFIVVLIMYIWGGEGVRGFSFAMLVGVVTGAYSTLAVASPMLLTTGAGGGSSLKGPNPFQRKEEEEGNP